jgi:hypothetical protein
MKIFLKNINILNLLLLILAIFLSLKLGESLVDKNNIFTISKSKEALIENEEKTVKESTANYLDYGVISEKNLFHPLRKIPSEIKEEQQMAIPDIVLYGTLITDDKKIAYIEDRKSPYSTPGRGKRQVAVKEGDMIAGYKLVKVNPEFIFLVHGENKITVTLSTGKERRHGEAIAKTTSAGAAHDSTSRQSVPPVQLQTRPKPYMPPLPQLPPKPVVNTK